MPILALNIVDIGTKKDGTNTNTDIQTINFHVSYLVAPEVQV